MILRLKQMLIKEFLQILRDPRMRMVIFGMPVIQLVVMAFALTTDVNHIRTAVLDMDKTPASRELISRFTAGNYFEVVQTPASDREIQGLLDRAEVRAVIHIPQGFEKDVAGEGTGRVQILTDGTDSNTTAIVTGYAEGIIQAFSADLREQRLEKAGMAGVLKPVEIRPRALFNPNQESRFYYVPSLIAVMLFLFSLLLTSIGIVKEKEIGTIEQVMVTPIRKIEFILGKTLPYILTGYFTMTIMLIVAFFVFDIRVQGNLFLFYLLSGLYLFGNMGIALIISGSASTQQQAMLTCFLILMPCVMLSGFMFPVKNMPEVVQYATWLNPMRWYLEILRGIVMKGVGILDLWPAIAAQAALAVLFITLAWARFSKTLS
ncbi:ABC transporter permease [Desulfospira joergensenii]|uniref:ABC transporter permease n=1 Tax=Desulfospira joergensenii TaxID=53329 RepID=UPI0003B49D7A|nr:ABC transporter permease [Desulfospira joergensenii]